jgi:hypothetical protein
MRPRSDTAWIAAGAVGLALLGACGGGEPEIVHVYVPSGTSSPAPSATATQRVYATPPRVTGDPGDPGDSGEGDGLDRDDRDRRRRRSPPPPDVQPSSCPSSRSSVPIGQGCTGDRTCTYGRSTCVCSPERLCQGAMIPRERPLPSVWSCTDPRTDGCPDEQPNVGTRCNVRHTCTYGWCGGWVLACVNGAWKIDHMIAPPP